MGRRDHFPDRRLAKLAREEKGVLDLDEIRACGLSKHAVCRRVERGTLHRIHHRVFAVGHAGLTRDARFLAAVKACGPKAALSHFAAGAHWGFLTWDDRDPEVTLPGTTARVHRGIRVHRTKALPPGDVRHHDGIRTTSPARTLVDLAARLDYRPLRRAVRQAQSMQLVNGRELTLAVTRLGRRRGMRNLRRILATDPAPTRSELEDVVLDLMIRSGLAHPDVNVPLVLSGRRVVPDFRWPEPQLVVEADGAAWHEGKLACEDDAERQALLEAHGNRVVRVTWAQAVARPRQTLLRLRAAGAPAA